MSKLEKILFDKGNRGETKGGTKKVLLNKFVSLDKGAKEQVLDRLNDLEGWAKKLEANQTYNDDTGCYDPIGAPPAAPGHLQALYDEYLADGAEADPVMATMILPESDTDVFGQKNKKPKATKATKTAKAASPCKRYAKDADACRAEPAGCAFATAKNGTTYCRKIASPKAPKAPKSPAGTARPQRCPKGSRKDRKSGECITAFDQYRDAAKRAEAKKAATFSHKGKVYERHEWSNGVPVWKAVPISSAVPIVPSTLIHKAPPNVKKTMAQPLYDLPSAMAYPQYNLGAAMAQPAATTGSSAAPKAKSTTTVKPSGAKHTVWHYDQPTATTGSFAPISAASKAKGTSTITKKPSGATHTVWNY